MLDKLKETYAQGEVFLWQQYIFLILEMIFL